MTSSVKIKDWKEDDRPREKMFASGAKNLSDSELISILIRTGNREETAIDLARKLLANNGYSLKDLSKSSIENLCTVCGIGKTKAITILAAFEIGCRVQSEIPEAKPQIINSLSVVNLLGSSLKNLEHEECWVLYLNRANILIGKERVSTGGLCATVVDIKIIIKRAIEKLASSIILVHNHPSGSPYPGEQDKIQTRHLKEAASMMDISLLDHIIIAGDKHYSFSDESCV